EAFRLPAWGEKSSAGDEGSWARPVRILVSCWTGTYRAVRALLLAAPFPGLSAADLFGYDPALALSKMSSSQSLMHAQGQHALKQAAMAMGAGGSQAIYDGGFRNASAAQQLMYY
ncbi:hypothetical protein B296_00031002, partial [Ensete ventricosum]